MNIFKIMFLDSKVSKTYRKQLHHPVPMWNDIEHVNDDHRNI